MALDILGPASAQNSITTRPAPVVTYGATRTWFKACSSLTTQDGTQVTNDWLNAILAQFRTAFDGTGIVEDNGDDMLLRAIQSAGIRYGTDIGTPNALVVDFSPAVTALAPPLFLAVLVANDITGAATIDANGLGNIQIVGNDGKPTQALQMLAGQIAFLACISSSKFQLLNPAPVALQADTTFYVNGATGSDTLYDGTSATVSGSHGPWATPQHAADYVTQFNLNGHNITIKVADGATYGAIKAGAVEGSGQVLWVGNPTTPGNCVINGVNQTAISVAGATHSFNGFKVQTSGTPTTDGLNGFGCAPGSNVVAQNIEYGSCGGSHNRLVNATMGLGGSVKISGGSAGNAFSFGAFLECDELSFGNFGSFTGAASTWTFVGTPAFGTAFYCLSGLSSAIWGTTTTVVGGCTGPKFSISQNSILTTGGQGLSALPGSSAGTISSGAQYS